MLRLPLCWVKALPDCGFRSQTRLIKGIHTNYTGRSMPCLCCHAAMHWMAAQTPQGPTPEPVGAGVVKARPVAAVAGLLPEDQVIAHQGDLWARQKTPNLWLMLACLLMRLQLIADVFAVA